MTSAILLAMASCARSTRSLTADSFITSLSNTSRKALFRSATKAKYARMVAPTLSLLTVVLASAVSAE